MPTYPLPYRIHDFLTRQIAWLTRAIEELDTFCALPDETDFEDILANQQHRERETLEMAREYKGLSREWNDAEDVSAEDRQTIAARSRIAQELQERLKDRYAVAEQKAEAQKERKQNSINDLRRGRRSVNIYKPGILVSPGFIDKQA